MTNFKEESSNGYSIPCCRGGVEILWTGGFDSTFRVVQLSRLNITIQPYYISDNRKSEQNELTAINNILCELKKNENAKAIFRELRIIPMSERVEDAEISEAFHTLRENDFFGGQYEWLAWFAKKHQGIELSIHQDDKALLLIKKYGRLKKISDDILGDYYIIDKDNSNKNLVKLFENYHLPLVYFSKKDMRQKYIDDGYKEIMNMTWFCYNPINGKPCGHCNPCMYTIEEGLKDRFSSKALLMYYLKKFLMKTRLFNFIKHR